MVASIFLYAIYIGQKWKDDENDDDDNDDARRGHEMHEETRKGRRLESRIMPSHDLRSCENTKDI